jgi:hypothetical protein
MVAGISLLAALGVLLARSTPSWWRPADPDAPGTRLAAEALEHGVVNQVHAWRPRAGAAGGGGAWRSEPWTVSLSEGDANAWLAASLPKWLANLDKPARLPPELSELQVAFASGVVRIGGRIAHAGAGHTLSASVRPEIRADGSLWLAATWVRLGRMPVPASWLLERAMDDASELGGAALRSREGRAAARVLAGMEPAAREPELRLADGRRVRLLRIEAREDQLWLTCRTEGRP